MIKSLIVTDADSTPIPWWSSVPAFKRVKKFDFETGLTILWGPNGSGKSTLLRALARMTVCEQGGMSQITESSTEKFMGRSSDPTKCGYHAGMERTGMEIVTDGQPCFFYDPHSVPGVIDGGGAFDYDFADADTLYLAWLKKSSGQIGNARLGRILREATRSDAVVGWGSWRRKKPTREFPQGEWPVNEVWARCLDVIEANLAPKCDRGPRTLLLDEPDRSLDIPSQIEMWKGIPLMARRLQVIVASHNPLALGITDATWMEMQTGYRETCLKALDGRCGKV